MTTANINDLIGQRIPRAAWDIIASSMNCSDDAHWNRFIDIERVLCDAYNTAVSNDIEYYIDETIADECIEDEDVAVGRRAELNDEMMGDSAYRFIRYYNEYNGIQDILDETLRADYHVLVFFDGDTVHITEYIEGGYSSIVNRLSSVDDWMPGDSVIDRVHF